MKTHSNMLEIIDTVFTEHTVQLLSYKVARCEFCKEHLHDNDDGDLSHAINHYLAHGMRLLYTGQSSYELKNDIVHGTTALLGSRNKPNVSP